MQRSILNDILKYGILLLSVSSIRQWLHLPLGSSALWWALEALLMWSIIRSRGKSSYPFWYVIWVAYIVVSSCFGIVYCRDYWDWKLLISNVLSYSICMASLLAFVSDQLQRILGFLYKHIWKIFFLLVLFMTSDGISKFMMPFSFLALFFPLLNRKSRRYVLIGLVITLIFGYECRSDVIKFLFCIIIGVFSSWCEITKYIKKWWWVLYTLPFLFFILAASGTFNVFNVGEMLNLSKDEKSRVNVADTRTFLYEEVISTSLDRGTMLFGNTPARGYYSEWFIKSGDDSDVMGELHIGERGGTESSVLNVFLHFGIIGLFIYLMMFGHASFLAIFQSNNNYIPIVGAYIAFRFLIGWVEDFTRFDLNMFYLWAMIGMCYSPYFRNMSNDEFSEWLNNMVA